MAHLMTTKALGANQDWTLISLDVFHPLCLDEQGQGKQDFTKLLERFSVAPRDWSPFRLQVRLEGVAVMMAVYPADKLIRVATPRLNNELFILHLEDYLKGEGVAGDIEIDQPVRDHIEAIATLDPREFPSQYQWTTLDAGLIDILDSPYPEHQNGVDKLFQSQIDRIMVFLHEYRPVFFEKISDIGLSLVAQFALLRIHLLKFLAILPSLDHDKKGVEVKRILLESLRRLLEDSRLAKRLSKKGQERALTTQLRGAVRIAHSTASFIPAPLLASLIRASVRFMARRFIAGETIEETQKSFQGLFQSGRDVTLDQLGELVVSEKEADHYRDEVLKLIRGLGQHIPKGELNGVGINRAHVSIKVSALCSHFIPESPEVTYGLVAPRLKEILLVAKDHEVFINIDAEHYHYRDIVLEIYARVLKETPELKDFKATGIVLQAYLRDAAVHLEDISRLARERGLLMPIRLVKGAYWDAETVEADAHSFNAPQFLNKEETDLMFRQMILEVLKRGDHLQLCLASHNFADHCYAQAYREVVFPSAPGIEHQCLHMTYEALSTSLAKMGWATRNYVPIGSLLVGMAYLVRRIMENSSQVGVLTIMRSHKKAASLQGPEEIHRYKMEKKELIRDLTQEQLTEKFFNCAPLRTYLKDELHWAQRGLDTFRQSKVGASYSNSFPVSGEEVAIKSSSNEEICVGKLRWATAEDAQKAVEQADQSYRSQWCEDSPRSNTARIRALLKASELMMVRRNELSALIMFEAGKSLKEAYGDVDEAIDFLNFYAREQLRLLQNDRLKGMRSRGPTAVISPWNFPLAIPCGMVCSSLVAGNPVVLKSAEQTPLIAQVLVDLLHEAGVPKDALIHLPGPGETVGDALVRHQKIAAIVFTGSKAVGLFISNTARKRLYHNTKRDERYPVKVITEMGGKNAVIVTANAELDETVAGVLYSAFGHAGQKCSAASRIIVHHSVAERLKERLAEAIKDLKVGEAFDFATDVNPVISAEDKERIQKAALESAQECKDFDGEVVISRADEEAPGYCVGPSLFEVPAKRALDPSSWSQREIFGPVVHLIPVADLDEALHVFNSTEYALTGGVFSQSQDEIDWLTSRMECGNIYVNRSITGARVAIEPFGGFKLSGTGPKAGGKSYLRALSLLAHGQPQDELIGNIGSEQEGSDYQFDLARPSGLATGARGERLYSLIEELHHKYEVYFHKVEGANKELLENFQRWVNNNFLTFMTKQHENRKIPGQISFNDFSLHQEHAVLVASLKRPELITMIQVLSAMGVGVGVTVLARSRESYLWWMTFRDMAHSKGFSYENFEVYYPSLQGLKRTLSDGLVSTLIIDAKADEILFCQGFEIEEQKRVRSLLSPLDSVPAEDFKGHFEHYIWPRAFAINTMRHGAPLELELNE